MSYPATNIYQTFYFLHHSDCCCRSRTPALNVWGKTRNLLGSSMWCAPYFYSLDGSNDTSLPPNYSLSCTSQHKAHTFLALVKTLLASILICRVNVAGHMTNLFEYRFHKSDSSLVDVIYIRSAVRSSLRSLSQADKPSVQLFYKLCSELVVTVHLNQKFTENKFNKFLWPLSVPSEFLKLTIA